MTRVRAEDYEDKKQVILERAAALIGRKGFERATMMDVANSCGASKSHVYHYFQSKEELLFAIVHEHVLQQRAELARIVALPLPAQARFEQYVQCFLQGAARSRDEHLVLMNDLKFLPRAQREQVQQEEVKIMVLMTDLLSELNPDRMADREMRTPYSLLLFGMMIWTFTWYSRSGPVPPKELAAKIADLFVNGFRSAPAKSDHAVRRRRRSAA